MTAQTQGTSYSELREECQLAAGWKPPASWNARQTDQFNRILKKALQQYYNPPILPGERTRHDWSFLYPSDVLMLNSGYSTGTITYQDEFLEFSAALPSSIVTSANVVIHGWVLTFVDDNGVSQYVPMDEGVTADATTFTLVAPGGDMVAAAGTDFSLLRLYYDLPDDFGSIDSAEFTYFSTATREAIPLSRTSERELRSEWFRHSTTPQTGTPTHYALVPRVPTATDSGHWAVAFGPNLPDGTFTVNYRYRAIPPNLDGATHVYPYGSDKHGLTIIASIIDITHQQIHGNYDRHEAFLEALASSVMEDRQHDAPHNLGLSRSGSEEYGDLSDVLRDWHSQTPVSMTLPV